MACTVSCNTIKLAGTEVTHSSSEGASSRGQACTPNLPPTLGYLHSQLPRSISTSLCYSHPNTKVRNTIAVSFLEHRAAWNTHQFGNGTDTHVFLPARGKGWD